MSTAALRFDRFGELDALTGEQPADTEQGKRLLCIRCSSPITSSVHRLEIDGRREHAVTNPAGLHFVVWCFAHAPGCRCSGEYTLAHTWFPGCEWRFAHCAQCGCHNGWCYRACSGSSFFGLIREMLVEG